MELLLLHLDDFSLKVMIMEVRDNAHSATSISATVSIMASFVSVTL